MAIDQLRVDGEKDVMGVHSDDLSLQVYQTCAPLYAVPAHTRDAAASLIQRSLRAKTAWRTNLCLQQLASKDAKKWGFGRGEPRTEVVHVLGQAVKERASMMGTDLRQDVAGLHVSERVSTAEVYARKVQTAMTDLAEAVEEIQHLEHWAIAEIKLVGNMKGDQNFLIRQVAEAVCVLLGEGGDVKTGKMEWDVVTKVLGDKKLKQRLLAYDVNRSMHNGMLQQLQNAYTIFEPEFAPSRTGKATEGLCSWVRAIYACKKLLLQQEEGRKRSHQEDANLEILDFNSHSDDVGISPVTSNFVQDLPQSCTRPPSVAASHRSTTVTFSTENGSMVRASSSPTLRPVSRVLIVT